MICHEGWRYPETVRWATKRGAQVVFQPQITAGGFHVFLDWKGTRGTGCAKRSRRWGDSCYEKIMVTRAMENAVYFASVTKLVPQQISHTSLVDRRGQVIGFTPYGKEELLMADIDPADASRRYIKRLKPHLYPA